MVEQETLNFKVQGSSPWQPTFPFSPPTKHSPFKSQERKSKTDLDCLLDLRNVVFYNSNKQVSRPLISYRAQCELIAELIYQKEEYHAAAIFRYRTTHETLAGAALDSR
jgi:hypothetical protein